MYSARGCGPDARRVSPFGNPRIKACSRLPGAYRGKPRPSSPAGAKASIVCPYTLDRIRDRNPGRRCNFYPELCCCQRTSRGRTRGSGPRRLRGGEPLPVARGEPVVGVPGVEPGTSSLSGTRSNQLSYTPGATRPAAAATDSHQPQTTSHQPETGGGNRDRTGDLMLAKHVLYQLSYAPKPAPPAALATCGQSAPALPRRKGCDEPAPARGPCRRALAGRHASGSRRRPLTWARLAARPAP